jgi:CRISPR/Cas system-associated exonuclease Cas4 (RecB family)
MIQYDLFGVAEKVSLEKIAWSNSKRQVLRQCPRKFYYQYFGASKKNAFSQPFKDRLVFLKQLSNKYLLQGEIVHTIIANYFNKIKKSGEEWNFERCKNWAYKMVEDSVEYSQKIKANIDDTRQFKPLILKEIYSSESVDCQELINESKEKIIKNIENFFYSAKFILLKNGGKKLGSIIEGKIRFEPEDGIKVEGVIDICYWDNDQFIIADWKTGKNSDEDTSLQLLAYALWAIQEKEVLPKYIKIQKAYLHEDKLEDLEFSEKNLIRAKSRIIQDVDEMRQILDFAKAGIFEAFDKCNQPKICALCPFQEVCIKN